MWWKSCRWRCTCLMRLGQQGDRLAPAIAPLLAPRDPALGRFQRTLGLAIPAGMRRCVSIGQGGKGFQPKVNAGFLSGCGKGCTGTSAQEKQTYQPSASG